MKIYQFLRSLLPKRLLTRFILIILIPLIVVQILVGFYFYQKHWDTIGRRLANDVLGEIQLIADWANTQKQPYAHLKELEGMLGLKLEWKENVQIPHFRKKDSALFASKLHHQIKDLKYTQTNQTLSSGEQEIYIQLDKGILKVVVPQKRFFSNTVPSFLLWMLCSSILLFGIAFLFMKNQVRAMVRLAKAAELFGMGQEIQFKPEGATEIRQAGTAFIEMKERITRYLKDRTTMLAGVSHDLRTPLTRMKLELSMLEPNETTKMLNQDIDEMEHMLTGYLDFARGAGTEEMEKIDLELFLKTLVDKYKRVGFSVHLHVERDASLMARPHELMRALSNLITNSQHYGNKTYILMGIRNDKIQIIIDDNGPGIPKKKRSEVFKAFHRLDPARNQNKAGVGLGMTIARDTILSHGGNITLETSPMKGLRVIITLPLEK